LFALTQKETRIIHRNENGISVMKSRRFFLIVVFLLAKMIFFFPMNFQELFAGAYPDNPKHKKILFIHDENLIYQNNRTGLTKLKLILNSMGFKVAQFFPKKIRPSLLSDYDILVFSTSWSNFRHGQRIISDAEARTLTEFVDNGGALFLIADMGIAHSWSSGWIDSVNKVGKKYGIEFQKDMICEPLKHYRGWKHDPDGGVDGPFISRFHPHPTTKGIKKILLNWESSLRVKPPARAIAKSSRSSWEDRNGLRNKRKNAWACYQESNEPSGSYPIMAIAETKLGGRLFVIGDSSWMNNTWIKRYSHQKLIKNIIRWLGKIESQSVSLSFSEMLFDVPDRYYQTALFPKREIPGLIYFIAQNFRVPHRYQENRFDCSEMAAYLEWLLENGGFKAWICIREAANAKKDNSGHAWVIALDRKGTKAAIEPTAFITPTDDLVTAQFKSFSLLDKAIILPDSERYREYMNYDHYYESIYEIPKQLFSEFDWWRKVKVWPPEPKIKKISELDKPYADQEKVPLTYKILTIIAVLILIIAVGIPIYNLKIRLCRLLERYVFGWYRD